MAKINLDAKNEALLHELESNSRTPLSKIARNVLVSKEVAHYRLQRLIKLGFITHFEPIIDYYALGHKCYQLLFNFQNMAYHIRSEIIDAFEKIPKAEVVVYLSSDWDIELNIWVNHTADFYTSYNRLCEQYAQYIVEKELFLIIKIHLFGHRYLYNQDLPECVLEDGMSSHTLDETSHLLLKHLEADARAEVLSLSRSIKLSAPPTHARLRHLAKYHILRRVVPVLDTSLLGYNTYRLYLLLTKPTEKNKFVTYLHTKTQVTKIYELIGNKDLDIELEFQNTIELDQFLEQLRLDLPYIKDFHVVNILNTAQKRKSKKN